MTTSESTDAWTCGMGLAANSVMPAQLALMLATTAEVLERHTRALDLDEPAGRGEHEAYVSLVAEHRRIADQLAALARQMEGYRDLPMCSHDLAVMTDPAGQAEAFARLTDLRRELVDMLREQMPEDGRPA